MPRRRWIKRKTQDLRHRILENLGSEYPAHKGTWIPVGQGYKRVENTEDNFSIFKFEFRGICWTVMRAIKGLTGQQYLLEFVIDRGKNEFLQKILCKHKITNQIGRPYFHIKSDRQNFIMYQSVDDHVSSFKRQEPSLG